MNETLRLFGKIAARSLMAWLKVILIGGLVSIIAFIISIVLLGNGSGPGFAGAAHSGIGAILGLIMLLVTDPASGLLFVVSLACLFFFMIFAGKYALQKAVYLVWHYKLGDFFVSRINAYLDRLFKKKEEKTGTFTNAASFKKELLQTAKEDAGTNKIQKRILNFLLKRLNLDGINFAGSSAEIRTGIVEKLRIMIGERIEPSLGLFWGLVILQVVLIIAAFVFDKR